MKIGGVDPKTLPTEEILVLPRGEGMIVFRAQGLPNMDEFNAMVPEPKPPVRTTSAGTESNLKDPDYVSTMAEYGKRRLAYLVVKTLTPSAIEWDTVKSDVPGTWANWEKEMQDSGISQVECNLILRLVLEANALDEAKLKRARESFLAGPQQVSAQ